MKVTSMMRTSMFMVALWVVLGASTIAAQSPVTGQMALTAPGLWQVTQNIATSCGSSPLIDVQAHGVTLDLQGFQLDCTDDSAPLIRANNFGDLVIKNGQLSGDQHSVPLILIEPPASLSSHGRLTYRLERLTMVGFATAVSARQPGSIATSSIEVSDCQLVSASGDSGLVLEGLAGVSVANSTIRAGRLNGTAANPTPNFGGVAIDLRSVGLFEIRGNTISQGLEGIRLTSSGDGVISNNALDGNHRGIALQDSQRVTIADNSLSCYDSCAQGIEIGDGSTENNIVRNSILGYPSGLVMHHPGNQYSDTRVMNRTSQVVAIQDASGGNIDGGRNVY